MRWSRHPCQTSRSHSMRRIRQRGPDGGRRSRAPARRYDRRVGGPGLSRREAEVLEALGDHLTNAEIAERLFISVRTVESHVSTLLRKLDADDRRALARV